MNKIIEAIKAEMLVARRAQLKDHLTNYQTLLGEINRVVKLDKKTGAALELDEDDVLKVIGKNLEAVKENMAIFESRNDQEKLEELAINFKILTDLNTKFAPVLMPTEEVNALITAEFDRIVAEGKTPNIGSLMGFINKNAPAKFDKQAASEFIKAKLA